MDRGDRRDKGDKGDGRLAIQGGHAGKLNGRFGKLNGQFEKLNGQFGKLNGQTDIRSMADRKTLHEEIKTLHVQRQCDT